VTFILAPSVGWLFLGRLLSGLSAGLMTGTATAALTVTARTGSGRRASLVSTTGRSEFIAAGFAGFAAFSLLGLFSSLVPTFLSGVLHDNSHALAGAVVFLAALALIVAGLSAASLPLFLAGTVVSGLAIGAVFMGSLAVANRLAPAASRGQVISTFFVFADVGLTVPVIAVGFGAQAFGDFRATLTCAIALAVIALGSMASIRRSAALRAAHSITPCPA
jgi:MFS family permease